MQKGVDEGTIVEKRVAVIRGRVLDRAGEPIEGAKVTILNHPELGYTDSREDGAYDMAANGGGQLTVNYEKEGFLSAQRQVDTPWQEFVIEADVVLVGPDSRVTDIAADAGEMQVARGNVVSDQDGTRQSTVLFPPHTSAEMVLPSGQKEQLSLMRVRATEYTVGDSGPAAMPAEIALNTGYQYAVDYSVDEALARDARSVSFSRPVIGYLENFLGFPVGQASPLGYYDTERATWVAEPNGRVVGIVRIEDQKALIDIDGEEEDDEAETQAELAALGISEDEQRKLAELYAPGQSLWRMPLSHFSKHRQVAPAQTLPPLVPPGIHDQNQPIAEPPDARPPGEHDPDEPIDPEAPEDPMVSPERPDETDPTELSGRGTIAIENQSFDEGPIDLVGTDFRLNYPDEVPGREDARRLRVRLSESEVPDGLHAIQLQVGIAGRIFQSSYLPDPGQSTSFVWDGLDAYERRPNCAQAVEVRLGYTYQAVYVSPAEYEESFGRMSGLPTDDRARQEITLWSQWNGHLGTCDQRGRGLGGWTIGPHHQYDPATRTLYSGSGTHTKVEPQSLSIGASAGTGELGDPFSVGDGGPAEEATVGRPFAVAADADGSYMIADWENRRIRKVSPSGTITSVAGTGELGFSGDDPHPASEATFRHAGGVDIAADGSIYVADTYNHRIRKIDEDGMIKTVAGSGPTGYKPPPDFAGDGGPATDPQVRLNEPQGIAVAPDGSFYFADMANNRIRHVGTDGVITSAAGNGTQSLSGDGGPATDAALNYPRDVDVAEDGTLYIADTGNHRIRKVTTAGVITTVAGWGLSGDAGGGFSGDGGLATEARMDEPAGVSVASDGTLFVADTLNHRIRKVSTAGIISTVAGSGPAGAGQGGYEGDGGASVTARLNGPRGVAVAADGRLLVSDTQNNRVRKIASPLPGFTGGEILVPARDGGEAYLFDRVGKHLQTIDSLTGRTRYSFDYTDGGLLKSVSDRNGNTTTIERDPATDALETIVGPDGQRTRFTTNADGYVDSVTNAANESVRFTYGTGGLLETYTNANDKPYLFRYDFGDPGRFQKFEDSVGGLDDLQRTNLSPSGHKVKVTSAEGRSITPIVQKLNSGDQIRDIEGPGSLQTRRVLHADGKKQVTTPEGYTLTSEPGPDPRWGMQAPIQKKLTLTTPGGKSLSRTRERELIPFDPPVDPTKPKRLTDRVTFDGKTWTSVFDGELNSSTSTSPEGRRASADLDADGRPSHLRPGPRLCPLAFTYDSRGRPETQSMCNRGITFTYNAQGFVETIKNTATGKGVTNEEYDPAGRLKKQLLPGDRRVEYGYDRNGNLTSVTPPERPAHTFSYDGVNGLESYAAPGAGPTTYNYNKDRQLDLITRPDDSTIDFDYDQATGRRTGFDYRQGRIAFDYVGQTKRLDRMSSPDETIGFAYNADGLPERKTFSGAVHGSVGLGYDPDNLRLSSTKVNDAFEVGLSYDDDGLVTGAGELSLLRNPDDGALDSTTLRKISTTLTPNGYGQLRQTTAKFEGEQIFDEGVHFDEDEGLIDGRTETTAGQAERAFSYAYDDAGRIEDVFKDGATNPVAHYEYDKNGNRTAYIDHENPERSVTETAYENDDRLIRYGDLSFTYTQNGELDTKINTATGEMTDYGHDGLGHLTTVELPNGKNLGYLYDAVGRRIGTKVDGDLVQGFIYGSQLHPIAELDGQSNVVARFVYASGTNAPDYMEKDNKLYRLIVDHLGSVRLVVDADSGQIAQQLAYDEYGNVLEDSNPGFQPFGYAGGLYDRHTGLSHFGARDYDPYVGRWITKDPIGPRGGLNVYEYAAGNPVNLVDVTGKGPDRPRPYWPPEYEEMWQELQRAKEGQVVNDWLIDLDRRLVNRRAASMEVDRMYAESAAEEWERIQAEIAAEMAAAEGKAKETGPGPAAGAGGAAAARALWPMYAEWVAGGMAVIGTPFEVAAAIASAIVLWPSEVSAKDQWDYAGQWDAPALPALPGSPDYDPVVPPKK